jgi:hypothetical protein
VRSNAISHIALRAGLGFGMVTLVSALIFRSNVFIASSPMFQCLTAGGMLAAIMALMRTDRMTQAAALASAFALLRLGFAQSQGWAAAIAGTIEIGGLFLLALIFDLLARRGILFGKFLVLGPMLGGIYLATIQLSLLSRISGVDLFKTLMQYVFLGLLIGDSVGLGVEVADLLVLSRSNRRQRSAG